MPGGTASLPLAFTGSGSTSGLQWGVTYPAAAVAAITATAGPALTAAGKTLYCNGVSGVYTCLATGSNTTLIGNGTVATVNITLSAAAAGTTVIGMTDTMGTDSTGLSKAITGVGGTITVMPSVTVNSLTCNPTTIVTPGTSACTATLSAGAPAGATLAVASSNTSLSVPASVPVTAGSTSATFTATAASVTTNQPATVTATLGSSSQSASLTLTGPVTAPVTLTSLACSPSSPISGGSSVCTGILSNIAPSGGVVVALVAGGSALAVPPSVTVPAGSSSTTFTATVGTIASTQTSVITASYNGNSLTNSLVLNPPSGPVILKVGPGQTYLTSCPAITAAPDGATIQIDASGTYSGDVCAIHANNLTLKGVNGRPKIDAAGQNAMGKGIWVIEGNNTTIDTIELTGATVPTTNNGAGVRMGGQNLTVLNSYIHDNQEGILTDANPGSQLLIRSTEFNHNGFGDSLTHNVHVNSAARLTMQYNYSHNANAGRLVLTEAAESYLLCNRLTSETGTSGVEVDIATGGRTFLIGNLIEKGPSDQSGGSLLGYLSGGHVAGSPSSELYVVNNTFVSDQAGNPMFLNIASADATPAVVTNNIFYGPGTMTNQGNSAMTTNFAGDPLFVNRAGYDYHLTSGSPAINAGSTPSPADGVALMPVFEYLSTTCAEARHPVGATDIGGYEFGGAGAPLTCSAISGLSLSPNTVTGPTVTTANTVTLSIPAPTGGAVVLLSSSNPSAASTPPSVTVPAGATSATFSITVSSVAASTAVTISAVYGSLTQSATLTVGSGASALLSSLTCNPTSLLSSASSTCTVTLSGAAGSGGAPVALSSNNSLLPAQASVSVAAGATTATFTVTAGAIPSNQTATLTATLSGVSKTASVNLVAPATAALSSLTCSPTSLSSGAASTCTVTLTSAAGSATTVTLSSNNPLLPPPAPASVSVAAGSTTAAFTATAGTIASNQTATVTATLSGVSKTATVNLLAPIGSTTKKYVQGNYATPQSSQTKVSVTFTAAQKVGDLNVVAVGWNDSTAVVSAVTDGSGNTYALAVGPTVLAGVATQSIYYAKNIKAAAAGGNAVTVTFATAAMFPDIRILEYSGADLSNPVDVVAASTGSSATSSSGSVTTTNPTDLLFGANLVTQTTTGPGSGFTNRLLTNPDADIAEDRTVTAVGSYSATAPVNSGQWIMQMVAFR